MPHLDHAGASLFYTLDGPDSAPVLIFSNALGTDHTMWAPQAEALRGQFRILRYDTRGHGRSTLPPGPFTVAGLGGDVLALMDALGIREAAFCGLSMGGLTGMWLGVNAPRRFTRLVLANTAARISTAASWNTRIDGALRGGMAPLVAASVQRWFTPAFASAAGAGLDGLRAVLAGLDARGYAANCAALRDADLREAVGAIPVPVLVIAGSADLSTPPAAGRALADAIPGARYVELEAAHLSSFEQPARFTDALRDFLGAEARPRGDAGRHQESVSG
ncbi:3-oxoadipate enol-lactonase [Cupriavidus basilensis]|uniref:3-oxoadipate enol-lactonase n=1 Tax=Cupriavidus basilensis TaxID=68895 RepID=UPI00075145BE|nr:3-oxoadipate enol-lactonase [Cupriavidus basilensis]